MTFEELLSDLAIEMPEQGKKGKKIEVSKDFVITKGDCIVLSEGVLNTLKEGKYIDIIDGTKVKWKGNKEVNYMFIAFVPNTESKASIQITFDEKNAELTKFKVAYIKKFKEIATRIYNINWEETPNVDFEIHFNNGIQFPVFFVPRTEKTGEEGYVRRENIVIYPITPVVSTKSVATEESNEELANEITIS